LASEPLLKSPEQLRYFVIWDNASFHRVALVRNWFTAHPCFVVVYHPPSSPLLNHIEDIFSIWRWEVYDRNPQMCIPLVQAMEDNSRTERALQVCQFQSISICGHMNPERGHFRDVHVQTNMLKTLSYCSYRTSTSGEV